MSHFYASIEGNRGMATRCGTKNSGIQGHIRGWGIGARVCVDYDEKTDSDIVRVYRTGGSRACRSETLIAEFGKEED